MRPGGQGSLTSTYRHTDTLSDMWNTPPARPAKKHVSLLAWRRMYAVMSHATDGPLFVYKLYSGTSNFLRLRICLAGRGDSVGRAAEKGVCMWRGVMCEIGVLQGGCVSVCGGHCVALRIMCVETGNVMAVRNNVNVPLRSM